MIYALTNKHFRGCFRITRLYVWTQKDYRPVEQIAYLTCCGEKNFNRLHTSTERKDDRRPVAFEERRQRLIRPERFVIQANEAHTISGFTPPALRQTEFIRKKRQRMICVFRHDRLIEQRGQTNLPAPCIERGRLALRNGMSPLAYGTRLQRHSHELQAQPLGRKLRAPMPCSCDDQRPCAVLDKFGDTSEGRLEPLHDNLFEEGVGIAPNLRPIRIGNAKKSDAVTIGQIAVIGVRQQLNTRPQGTALAR